MANSPAITPEDLATAEHHVLEDTGSEHISLGSEYGTDSSEQPQTVADEVEIRDWLRRRAIAITFYEQGFVKITETRGGKRQRSHCIDLRFLDTVPSVVPYFPRRLVKAALGAAGVAALAGALAQFSQLSAFALPTAIAAASVAAFLLYLFVYLSHEKITFQTMHGRAQALWFKAGLGQIRKFRAILPQLVRAIEDAGESIGDDTIVYLRAEMREHYRLRGDGILTEEACSESTGRILTHFDLDI
jgi:hypothetical protein